MLKELCFNRRYEVGGAFSGFVAGPFFEQKIECSSLPGWQNLQVGIGVKIRVGIRDT